VLLLPLARENPIAALQAVQGIPQSAQPNALANVYGEWSKTEPYAAAVHAFANNAPAKARENILLRWASKDVSGAYQFLSQSVSDTERAVLLEDVFNRVLGSDRVLQMEPLLELIPPGEARDNTLGSFLRQAFSKDPQAAIDRLALELDAGGGYRLAASLLRADEMTDQLAIQIIDQLAPGDRDQAVSNLAWAQNLRGISDQLRFELINDIADQNTRNRAANNLLSNLARKDPQAAVQMIENTENQSNLRQYYVSVARTWASHNPEAAFSWATMIEDIDLRKDAVGSTLMQMSRSSPELAFDKVRSFEEAEVRTASLEYVARNLTDRNPQAFADFISDLPEEEVSPRVYGQTADAWLRKDPLSGSKWVDSIPPGKKRDAAISGLTDALRSSDPKSAFIWSTNIDEDRQRRQAMRNSLKSLAENDPEAAVAIVEESGLSEQDYKAISYLLPKE